MHWKNEEWILHFLKIGEKMIQKFDFLIIGSGIAGMSFALKVAHKGKVALICKTELEEANTYFAQGGVASVTNTLVDNFEKHIEDTMIMRRLAQRPRRSRESRKRSSFANQRTHQLGGRFR